MAVMREGPCDGAGARRQPQTRQRSGGSGAGTCEDRDFRCCRSLAWISTRNTSSSVPSEPSSEPARRRDTTRGPSVVRDLLQPLSNFFFSRGLTVVAESAARAGGEDAGALDRRVISRDRREGVSALFPQCPPHNGPPATPSGADIDAQMSAPVIPPPKVRQAARTRISAWCSAKSTRTLSMTVATITLRSSGEQ